VKIAQGQYEARKSLQGSESGFSRRAEQSLSATNWEVSLQGEVAPPEAQSMQLQMVAVWGVIAIIHDKTTQAR